MSSDPGSVLAWLGNLVRAAWGCSGVEQYDRCAAENPVLGAGLASQVLLLAELVERVLRPGVVELLV